MFQSFFAPFAGFNSRSTFVADDDSSDVDLVGSAPDQELHLRGSTTAKGHPHQESQITRRVVDETPPASSDSGGESADPSTETTSTRTLRFNVIEKEMEETETFDYLSNVLNWRAEPFVGKHQLCPSVRFGPYTLTELIDAVKTAADASGFATYAFRGARKSETSCSIKFGCEGAATSV